MTDEEKGVRLKDKVRQSLGDLMLVILEKDIEIEALRQELAAITKKA